MFVIKVKNKNEFMSYDPMSYFEYYVSNGLDNAKIFRTEEIAKNILEVECASSDRISFRYSEFEICKVNLEVVSITGSHTITNEMVKNNKGHLIELLRRIKDKGVWDKVGSAYYIVSRHIDENVTLPDSIIDEFIIDLSKRNHICEVLDYNHI